MLKKKRVKIPIGDLIDKLYRQDKEIDDIEATLREAKSVRENIQEKLLESFGTDKLSGAKGKLAMAIVKKTPHPSIKHYPKFLKYVIANKAWDLFQKRVTSTAYFDRIEQGAEIPGIEIYNSTRVSVQRIKR